VSKPVRSADIAELRAFCAAVDLGSVGRAARLLRVSQPALSKRVRGLEALAGARLLDRGSRGVSPTPAGARLYAEARRLLEQAERVEELLAGLSDPETPIRLAVSHTVAEFVLPGPLVEYESHSERRLSVELLIANSSVVRELVRDGRAEVGIAAIDYGRADPHLECHPLVDDEVVVAVPDGHPWLAYDEIPLDEFLRTPMVLRDPGADARRAVDDALSERGETLAPSLAEVGSTSAARSAAVAHGAPVVLSRLAVAREDDGLTARRVEGMRFMRRFAIFLSAVEAITPGARGLVDHLLRAHNRGL
jgi:DNA-binding transcriptional LysR family regulator